MKKFSLILTLVLLVCLFSACGNSDNNAEATTTDATTGSVSQDVEIEISKDSLSDVDEFLENMKKYGAEVEGPDDSNSYVLVFSGEEHQKLLDDKRKEIIKAFKEYEEDENHYIDSIEYDEDFRNLVFNVNDDLYDESTASTNNMLIAAKVLVYQMYLGETQKTNVEIIYSGTEDVISTFSLPMNLG